MRGDNSIRYPLQELGCTREDALSLARRRQSPSDATSLPRPRMSHQLQTRWTCASLGQSRLPRVRSASGTQTEGSALRTHREVRARLEGDATRSPSVVRPSGRVILRKRGDCDGPTQVLNASDPAGLSRSCGGAPGIPTAQDTDRCRLGFCLSPFRRNPPRPASPRAGRRSPSRRTASAKLLAWSELNFKGAKKASFGFEVQPNPGFVPRTFSTFSTVGV